MKFFSRKAPKGPIVPVKPESLRLLTEYVLHMSITCLADEDIEPLYKEYIEDPRLGTLEKDELTQAYLALHLRSAQSTANA